MLKRFLFSMAKAPLMGRMVGCAFQYCSWVIPVKKRYSSEKIIAFDHPRPSYENHMILSPKRAVESLQQMESDGLSEYFAEIWKTANDISATRPGYRDGFVMVANGGKRQEVQQVHFHLFTHHPMVNEYTAQGNTEAALYRDEDICVLAHPNPNWEIHYVVSASPMKECNHAYFRGVLRSIRWLNNELDIVQRGYSLVYQYYKGKSDPACPVFHIVSGKRQG